MSCVCRGMNVANNIIISACGGWTVDVEGIFAGHCTINMYENQFMIHTIDRSEREKGEIG